MRGLQEGNSKEPAASSSVALAPSASLQDRQQIIEVGHYGLHQEVEQLKRDKNVLMQEVIRLRQQQQVRCQLLGEGWTAAGGWQSRQLMLRRHGMQRRSDLTVPAESRMQARMRPRVGALHLNSPHHPPPMHPSTPSHSQDSNEVLVDLQDRLEMQEQRQQQMIGFLAAALQNPGLVQARAGLWQGARVELFPLAVSTLWQSARVWALFPPS